MTDYHRKARKYFIDIGLIPKEESSQWVIHHIDDKMKTEDPERYKLWRPQDLWPLKKEVHTALHNRDRIRESLSDEQRKHVSEGTRKAMDNEDLREHLRSKKLGSLNPNFGKKKSDDTIEKSRNAKVGMKFWNDGVKCIRARECPGPGWKNGNLKLRKNKYNE